MDIVVLLITVLLAVGAAVGGYLNFTSKGGNIKELGDMDKLKASFTKTDAATPPPPIDLAPEASMESASAPD